MLLILPKNLDIPSGNLDVSIKFGFSNAGSDIDNPLKMLVDILQKKYGFNDNKIYKMNLEKIKTKKGCEFIEFDIRGVE